jgi:hypothetical protein
VFDFLLFWYFCFRSSSFLKYSFVWLRICCDPFKVIFSLFAHCLYNRILFIFILFKLFLNHNSDCKKIRRWLSSSDYSMFSPDTQIRKYNIYIVDHLSHWQVHEFQISHCPLLSQDFSFSLVKMISETFLELNYKTTV